MPPMTTPDHGERSTHPPLNMLETLLLLACRAGGVRFVFDGEALSVQNRKVPFLDGDDVAFGDETLVSSGENFVVGGANRWRGASF